jgi:hypothetical protein
LGKDEVTAIRERNSPMDDEGRSRLEDPEFRKLLHATLLQNNALKELQSAVSSIAGYAFKDSYTGTDASGQRTGLYQLIEGIKKGLEEIDVVLSDPPGKPKTPSSGGSASS